MNGRREHLSVAPSIPVLMMSADPLTGVLSENRGGLYRVRAVPRSKPLESDTEAPAAEASGYVLWVGNAVMAHDAAT